MAWYWCLEHHCVEESLGCGSSSRIGPYDTEAQAQNALSRIHEREKEQTARDESDEKKYGKKRTWW